MIDFVTRGRPSPTAFRSLPVLCLPRCLVPFLLPSDKVVLLEEGACGKRNAVCTNIVDLSLAITGDLGDFTKLRMVATKQSMQMLEVVLTVSRSPASSPTDR